MGSAHLKAVPCNSYRERAGTPRRYRQLGMKIEAVKPLPVRRRETSLESRQLAVNPLPVAAQ